MQQRRMTPEEMSYYLKQIERRGKALSLPADQLERYREEYDKITAHLKKYYQNFICSSIIRRNRYIDLDVFRRFVEEEEDGMLALAKQALREGNAEDFSLACWLLHLKYMVMWKSEKEENYA